MQILISRNSELPPVPVTIDVDSHSLTAVLRRLDDLGVLPGQNIDRLYSEAGQLITKFDQIRENGHYVVTATSAPMLDNDATVDALADRARPRAPPKQRSREAILFPTKVNSSPGAAAVSPLPRMEDDESAHETVSPMPVIPKRHTDRLPRFARRHSAESLLLPPAIVDSTQEQTRPTAAKISPLKKRISLQDVFSEEERLREEILRRQDGRNSMVPPELEHPAFADVPASDSPRRSSSIVLPSFILLSFFFSSSFLVLFFFFYLQHYKRALDFMMRVEIVELIQRDAYSCDQSVECQFVLKLQ
eukprot:m.610833 g.610833  ORF g.610833 m.610833 type:complete len:304 (+) comp58132_c0_seq9:129-1040(+)